MEYILRSKNTSISDIRYLAIKGSEFITEAERRIKANKFVDRRETIQSKKPSKSKK